MVHGAPLCPRCIAPQLRQACVMSLLRPTTTSMESGLRFRAAQRANCIYLSSHAFFPELVYFCGFACVLGMIIFAHREIRKTYVAILALRRPIGTCAAPEISSTSEKNNNVVSSFKVTRLPEESY